MAHRPFVAAFAASLAGCTAGASGLDLPRPRYGGEGFFDRPWPSDLRTIDGHPDLSDFPNPNDDDLLQAYLALGESLDGFGNNSPIYLRFDGDIDTSLLSTPERSTSLDSPVLLLDVDPYSAHRGEAVPFTWTWQQDETTWKPSHLLAVQPVWGFPLRPHTTYALVVTTKLAAPVPGFADVWNRSDPDHAVFQPLQDTLFQLRIPTEQVAVATVFTTQDPVGEMAAIADRIHDDLSTPALDQVLTESSGSPWFKAYVGTMWVPLWQHGEKPYLTDGGGFEFAGDGTPLLAGWERVHFTFSVPRGRPMPAHGWPVVIYAHGTGGSYQTFASGSTTLLPAAVLGRAGLAGFGISQPLHDDRGTGIDPSIVSFNYLNPTAARCTFRQGALDQIYLAEVLTAHAEHFTSADGLDAWTDPTQVAYLGHSQGGVVGAMALPFFDGHIRGAVLSGAGGGLSYSLVHRDAGDYDIQGMLTSHLDLSEGEQLTTTHPIVALVQFVGEATDPINYGPYWSQAAPEWTGTPVSVLMTEGLQDVETPPPTTEALAAAGGVPILDPVAQTSTANELLGLTGEPTPAVHNITAWDGTPVTAGLAQYPEQDHFAIFEDEDAAALYQDFLASAVSEDVPEIPAR